jgi:hypothetical protein
LKAAKVLPQELATKSGVILSEAMDLQLQGYSGLKLLAVLAVQQIAHRVPPRLIQALIGSARADHPALRRHLGFIHRAALRAAVGKARLIGLQFKLF